MKTCEDCMKDKEYNGLCYNCPKHEKTCNLFVYGTLKKGFRAHFVLKDSKYLGERTITHFKLINLGRFPGLVHGNEDDRVTGELYEIKEELLETLDAYEGVPDLYTREIYKAGPEAAEKEFFYYLYNVGECGYSAPEIPDGFWR